MKHSSIHWFRKGLRLHDNPALLAALRDCAEIRPVFILDPWFPRNTRVGINRWRFLLDALKDLDGSLRKLNSRLFVVRGKPTETFPRLFRQWKVTRLTFEMDTEPYSRQRDAEVVKLAEEHGVEVIQKVSNTLYDSERVIVENNGTPPLTYKRLQTVLSFLGLPKRPVPAPKLEDMKGEWDYYLLLRAFIDCNVRTPCSDSHEEEFGVPTLEELGQDPLKAGPHLYPGGEGEALRRLDQHMQRVAWVCNFKKPETEPNTLTPSTTVLSPYMKFGCLSARTFWWRLTDVYRGKQHSEPPVSLHGQLLWREFFYTAGAGIPNFHRMEGNSVCVQVDWDTNEEHLAAWREVFEDLLLDADWSLNAGNWQWLSASAFFHQFFRVYSPVAFGKKTDKKGDYIRHVKQNVREWNQRFVFFNLAGLVCRQNERKYIPLLRKFPVEYIYEPWKAPLSIQERAGCIVGRDYPRPIVEHDIVSKRNVQRMKAAYARRAAPDSETQAVKTGAKRKADSVADKETEKNVHVKGKQDQCNEDPE
ncbi:UNVERIFIED_CONTAM: hypothetical protein FKN15_005322 [Acipenser sinensis]